MTKDGVVPKHGDKLYKMSLRDENLCNLYADVVVGEVIERKSDGKLVVMTEWCGNFGFLTFLGDWYSSVSTAKADAIKESREKHSKMLVLIEGAKYR